MDVQVEERSFESMEIFENEILRSEMPIVLYFTYTNNFIFEVINKRLYNVFTIHGEFVKLITLDILNNSELISKLRIKEVPTIFFINKGEILKVLTGIVSEKELDYTISKLLIEA